MNNSLSGVRHAHAMLIGRRINLRRLSQIPVPPGAPIRIEIVDGGSAWVFRFGVVVFFDVTSPTARAGFVDRLDELITDRVDDGEFEALEFILVPGAPELLRESVLQLDSDDPSSLQVVADVLAKSVVLDHHERLVASTFDRVEPLAEGLSTGRRRIRRLRGLVAHIGEMLLVQHRMVGRAGVGEKPDLLWDRPDLERLFVRLEQEYEIRERREALECKLNLISTTAQTLLELVQAQRTLRVEWYIVILIVVEIGLTLYELFFHQQLSLPV